MKIKISGFGQQEQILDVPHFEVLSDEDEARAMFYVHAGKDGISLEVQAGGTFKAAGKIYDNRFAVHPNAANSVTLRPVEYKA